MATWCGDDFDEGALGSHFFPQWGVKRLIVVKKIPGGDTNVIQKIGNDVQRVALPCTFTASQLANHIGHIGAQNTLDTSFYSGSAFLEDITDVQEVGAGKNKYTAVMHFIKV